MSLAVALVTIRVLRRVIPAKAIPGGSRLLPDMEQTDRSVQPVSRGHRMQTGRVGTFPAGRCLHAVGEQLNLLRGTNRLPHGAFYLPGGLRPLNPKP